MSRAQLPFTLLGEGDFRAAMDTACKTWRESCVSETDCNSFDGTRLHAYYAVPEEARACIVMLHGFCEFFGKYHEMAWYFYRAGFSFYFLEQRGHGKSSGKLDEADIVYVDDFGTYVKDLRIFLDRVVLPAEKSRKKRAFVHMCG